MVTGPRREAPHVTVALADKLRETLRSVPDFPRPGILFRDITPVLADPELFQESVAAMALACAQLSTDVVAGIEARGFILGGAVAERLGLGFVPIRKQGKLPARAESVAYALEYGDAVLEVHADAIRRGQRVALVDDLLATGGTAAAALALLTRLGGSPSCVTVLIELIGLDGAARLGSTPLIPLLTLPL